MDKIISAATSYKFLRAGQLLQENALQLNLTDILAVCVSQQDQEIDELTESMKQNRAEAEQLEGRLATQKQELAVAFDTNVSSRTEHAECLRSLETLAADLIRFKNVSEA